MTQSFWFDPELLPHLNVRTTEDLPTSASVVVIGAGLSGVSTVYWLTKSGCTDVVLLESRHVCSGATGRNGGHSWPVREGGYRAWEYEVACQRMIEMFLQENDLVSTVEFVRTG
jgi:glycine/D-amino acid oxidase-like deaminating enzyme